MSAALENQDAAPGQLALGLPDPSTLAVASPRLRPGDRIERMNVVYEFIRKVEGGKRFVRVDTGSEVTITNLQLVREMEQRVIRLAAPEWLNDPRKKSWSLNFESRSTTEKRLAEMRLAYVTAFDENRSRDYPLKVGEVLDRVYFERSRDDRNVEAGETKPSMAAVYEWLTLWNQKGSPRTIKRLCFAESHRGPRGVQICEDVKPLVQTALRELWYTPERTKIRTVWDRVVTEATAQKVPQGQIPCMRTIRRLIKALPPYAAARARLGTRAADLKSRSVGKMVEAAFPGEVYEVDAHLLNWVAIDPKGWPIGRLWVTLVIDRCTRCVVGFHVHVEPPCSLTIAAALRNAFAPKLYMMRRWPEIGREWPCWGLPNLVILDNGLENKAVFLTEALDEMGVAWMWAAPRTPEEKPHVERLFLTMDLDLATRIPGWTGSHPREKGDYDSVVNACLTLEQSDMILHRWVMNYNLDWHTGVRGLPEQLWRDGIEDFEVTPIEDIGMLDVLLGDFAERVPTRKGIELLGLRYGDKGEWRPIEHIRTRAGADGLKKVRIRFDRSDLSHIHVQDPVTKEYFALPSLDPDYTEGLTLARHRIIRRHAVERARGYVTTADLCRSRDELQRCIDEMTGREPMTQRRFAAVFNGLGSRGSYADFYRLAQVEYGASREDARSIVDLLERDEDRPLEEEGQVTKQGQAEPEPMKEPMLDLRSRANSLGVDVEGVALPQVAKAEPPATAAARPAQADDLAARMKKLGIELG
jgi:putative transposase